MFLNRKCQLTDYVFDYLTHLRLEWPHDIIDDENFTVIHEIVAKK